MYGVPASSAPLCLAFFLPQFHPCPDNDRWWGAGFTEWQNVARARPQFRGHYQPHIPADLGFYDLRLSETREQQAELAAEAGIDAFVYYHYWFNGTRLLERPFDEILASGRPTRPFCLAWANENWTRRWDGGEHEVLIAQRYSREDDLEHIRALRAALMDDRYLRRSGRPILLVYRSSALPDPIATTDLWRAEAESWGLPGLYLLRVESFQSERGDPRHAGFDGAVEFQPDWSRLPRDRFAERARGTLRGLAPKHSHRVVRYDTLVRNSVEAPRCDYPRWPGVTPGFDNTARRATGALILRDSTPSSYGRWLDHALDVSDAVTRDLADGAPGLVFVNAWNEWAEGNHLEPDVRNGRAFLDANRAAVDRHRGRRDLPGDRAPSDRG